jgi:transcriptional regulator with XRE-family HTH domain
MLKENKLNVGQRLRTFRERQGWSLRVLAEQCGLSINAISRIERGENSPTVSSLQRLASALAVPITDFFLELPKQSAYYIRNGNGKQVLYDCYLVEHLGGDLPGQQLEPFLYSIEPGCKSAATPVSHPGEEFIHCITGELHVAHLSGIPGQQPGTPTPQDRVIVYLRRRGICKQFQTNASVTSRQQRTKSRTVGTLRMSTAIFPVNPSLRVNSACIGSSSPFNKRT